MPKKCDICGKYLEDYKVAKRHARSVHPKEKMHYLTPGKRPAQYWWAMAPARSRHEYWLQLGAEPILGQPS